MQTQDDVMKCIFSLPPNLTHLFRHLYSFLTIDITTNGLPGTTTSGSPRLYQQIDTKSRILNCQSQCFTNGKSNTAWPTTRTCSNSVHAPTILPTTFYVFTATTSLPLSTTTIRFMPITNSTMGFSNSCSSPLYSPSLIFQRSENSFTNAIFQKTRRHGNFHPLMHTLHQWTTI